MIDAAKGKAALMAIVGGKRSLEGAYTPPASPEADDEFSESAHEIMGHMKSGDHKAFGAALKNYVRACMDSE